MILMIIMVDFVNVIDSFPLLQFLSIHLFSSCFSFTIMLILSSSVNFRASLIMAKLHGKGYVHLSAAVISSDF